ncbi:MAG: EscU/YscU/HrcU family type III secretion system export apparatus switch protein [Oscillospiraceae bacterium]|nr:EscU/YscU/HrcU family type III secretion system export apparatus switch protein [Oscillospiraceae bacterium]
MSKSEAGKSSTKDLKAAALKYTSDSNAAPVVVAAGVGYIAQKIVEIADEYGVAVYHDDSAATMLSTLKLGQEIPPELYQMVVDVYVAILQAAKHTEPDLGPADI